MEGSGVKEGYPKTPHLAFSPGTLGEDDVVAPLSTMSPFVGHEVVITEKMDGGNCCFKQGKVFARTHNEETKHKWFGPIKAMFQSIKYQMHSDEEIYAENMVAIHSIAYDGLRSLLFVFGIRDNSKGMWLSYDDMKARASELEIPTAPLLFRGVFDSEEDIRKWMDARIQEPSVHGTETRPEGFVIRVAKEFSDERFEHSIAKYVRKDHIQSVPNFVRNWIAAKLVE